MLDLAPGRTITWTFDDGPMAGVPIEHDLNADGSITWRIVGGPHNGVSVREQRYGAEKINDTVWVLSYRAASGHTLTAVLNFADGRVMGYGSDSASWESSHGWFSVVR
ncbi:MAG TPA: hypothetical protein VN706_12860 [Gemmatimonadaceae bacterium]|nr:hypothetical protein [Gemmatimonadaceae bacterium]